LRVKELLVDEKGPGPALTNPAEYAKLSPMNGHLRIAEIIRTIRRMVG